MHFAFAASVPVTYNVCTNELINDLTNRGYDKALLETQCKSSVPIPRADALNLLHIILRIHCLMSGTLFTNIPASSTPQNVVEMFSKNLPIGAYRRFNNLSDILVTEPNCRRLIILTMSGPLPVQFRCNSKNCTTWPYIDDSRDKYNFYSTVETVKSNPTGSLVILSMLSTLFSAAFVICNILWKPSAASKTILMNVDALYLTPPPPPVVTSKPQFQNTFSAIATLFP